ncbi:MAG: hypothetical protein R3212_09305, partial [Xanthomonadales bacterium]|nr:hypothetical protein [Xanthomonadales bacterium]
MSTSNPRLTLLALFVLFLVPLVVAWLMYTGVIDFSASETSNLGQLVEPPVQAQWPEGLERPDLAGHWLLLYPVSLACD